MYATRRTILGVGFALAGSACVQTPAVPASSAQTPGAAKADEIARALHAAFPTPALSVAIARKSGVIWMQAYGKADLEFDIAATPAHRFKLGSVSKIVTATAAAKLAVRRVVNLDAPISTWLPDLPEQHRA